jgi:hypothetical protein
MIPHARNSAHKRKKVQESRVKLACVDLALEHIKSRPIPHLDLNLDHQVRYSILMSRWRKTCLHPAATSPSNTRYILITSQHTPLSSTTEANPPKAQHPRPRFPPLLLPRRYGPHNDVWVLQSWQGDQGTKVRAIGPRSFGSRVQCAWRYSRLRTRAF